MRTLAAAVLALALALVPATAASAKKKPVASAAWAKKHNLKGNWRAKDADGDGLKNLTEYRLGTNPRKADTDRDGLKDGDEVKSDNDPLDRDTDGDGVKDGAEHAGVVLAFDGETIVIRQFTGPKLTVTVDDGCGLSADASSWDDDEDDSGEDDESYEDDGDDEESTCDFDDVDAGSVLNQAELEVRDGVTYLVDLTVV